MTDERGGYDEELDLTPPSVGAQYHPPETEDLLLGLRDLIVNARDLPLSASSVISKDEALALLDDALEALPEELRAARWLLKEREQFIARTRREAADILEQARDRAERMVERTEIVKAAQARANEIVDVADSDALRLRHEVEDFCDQKLASFEIVLERTQKLVAAGRAKLQGTNLLADAAAAHHGFEGPSEVTGGTSVPVTTARDAYGETYGETYAGSDGFGESVEQPGLYDDGAGATWDDAVDRWDDRWDDEPEPPRPRLTVVDDRYEAHGDDGITYGSGRAPDGVDSSGHPAGPAAGRREDGSNFFDQDLL
ncbi:MAG: ATP synthase F0 subunit B [Acidimicrobiia bacterium]|nr:ATP synthase F0 subunit B [Acidimicrobiia bacterium]